MKRYDVCWRAYEASVNSGMQCDSLILYSKDSLCTYTAMLWRCLKLTVCAHRALWFSTLYAISTFLSSISIEFGTGIMK